MIGMTRFDLKTHAEALRYLEWYGDGQYCTHWDDERAVEARERVAQQAAAEARVTSARERLVDVIVEGTLIDVHIAKQNLTAAVAALEDLP